MVDRHPMTSGGHRKLREALRHMKSIERPNIVKAIEEARAHGDLSENAEYHAAKEAQGLLEARIRGLDSRLSAVQIVEISKLSGTRVVFGATIDISEVDTGEERTITIVGEDESDATQGLISYQSPIARALIGKNIDDIAKVILPSGTREYEILDVRFQELPDNSATQMP